MKVGESGGGISRLAQFDGPTLDSTNRAAGLFHEGAYGRPCPSAALGDNRKIKSESQPAAAVAEARR